jgi:hypothetical protein
MLDFPPHCARLLPWEDCISSIHKQCNCWCWHKLHDAMAHDLAASTLQPSAAQSVTETHHVPRAPQPPKEAAGVECLLHDLRSGVYDL